MMTKKNLPPKKATLSGTVLPGDFPLGSAASRAAARAKLEARPKPPDIEVGFRDRNGECDPSPTTVLGKTFTREAGESNGHFKERVREYVRRTGRAPNLICWGLKEEKPA